MKKKIIIGFSIFKYNLSLLEMCDDKRKYEIALSDKEAIIYNSIDDFLSDLNNDLTDTENVYWFAIIID